MIKQIHIDKGQIGGVIQVITQSMFIVNILISLAFGRCSMIGF